MYRNVAIGGPGWDPEIVLPPEIENCRPDYSLYNIDYGIGHLTKGCPSDCEYCVVPKMEGREVKTVNYIRDIINPKGDLAVLLDANILASPYWPDHFKDIRDWNGWVDFTQGLDIRNVTDLAASQIAKAKITSVTAYLKSKETGKRLRKGRVHFAWYRMESENAVKDGIKLLLKYMPCDRLTFYMLVGYNTTWEQDWYRFSVLRDLGVRPFVMLYEGSGLKLRAFARWVNRMVYKVCDFKDYKRYSEVQGSLFEGVV